jgi:hypothetical protein
MANLIHQIKVFFNRQYPQSLLIQKPLWGIAVFTIILFLFAVIYQPLQMHGARSFSFHFTMLLYALLISTSVFIVAVIIKRTNCFSKSGVWTVAKELLSIVIILACIGIAAYFAGFIVEKQGSRWNLATFLDSFSRSVLIGIIPVLFPSLLNIRFAFTPEIFQEYQVKGQNRKKEKTEELIHIQSKAKKEDLSFLPDELIYAESEGNYVVFHLVKEEKTSRVIIRNSIRDIEQQLAGIPYFMRTHRAYIVNLGKVISKNGNSLGYQLKLKGSSQIVPVSRQNTRVFDKHIRKFLLSIHH